MRGNPTFCVSTCRYMKYLYPYECVKRKLSTPAELQAAIDGNRRDGRRTFSAAYSSQGADGTHRFGSPSPPLSSSSFIANHSPTMVPVHRTSPGPPTTPNDEVTVMFMRCIFIVHAVYIHVRFFLLWLYMLALLCFCLFVFLLGCLLSSLFLLPLHYLIVVVVIAVNVLILSFRHRCPLHWLFLVSE